MELVRDRRGAAYVEFILAFLPLFIFFLGIVQIALLYGASLVVEHSALRAVRTAAVVLDDDPRYYGGEDRNVLDGRNADTDDVVAKLSAMGVGVESGEIAVGERGRTLSRRASIELSAALVLLPLAPHEEPDSLADAIGASGLRSSARRTLERLEVDYPRRPNPGLDYDDDGNTEAERVTVRVRYRYQCAVPIVRRLVCRDGGLNKILEARETLPNHRAHLQYADGDWGG